MSPRKIVFAPSFDEELADIAVYIERQFGRSAKDHFLDRLEQLCENVAHFSGLGLTDHGYDTSLHGVVFGPNWVFFDTTETEVHFIHIVDGRRHKDNVRF